MSFRFGTSVVQSGLIQYLDAANPASYVNGSTSWNDISKNITVFQTANSPGYSSNNYGYLTFDGVNQCATSSVSTAGSNSDNYTISTWCQFTLTSYILNCQVFSRGRDTSGAPGCDGWSIVVGSSNNFYNGAVTQCLPGATSFTAASTIPTQVDTWVNLTATYTKNDSVKLYVNAALAATTAVGNFDLRSSIGAGWNVASIQDIQFADCRVATAMAYNRELSADEILQNYNALSYRFI